MTIDDWRSTPLFLGLTVTDLALALLAAIASYAAMRFALRLALGALKRLAGGGTRPAAVAAADVLRGTNPLLMVLTALLIGVGVLALPDPWGARVSHLWFLTLMLQLALWGNRAVMIGLARYFQRHATSSNEQTIAQASASSTLLGWALHTMLWTVALLAILSNLGVNITAFIASLGVGGIAVALAVQNILSDLFASLSIAIDKPFEVGDFIVVNAVSGTVEHVGLKSTRIRSLSGEQIVMSNTDLLKQTISNYKRMSTRRIVFLFGVTYDTTPEQAEQIPAIVKRLVERHDRLQFDRAHLKGFSDSALDFEVVYRVLVSDYTVFMDLQQRINLDLMRELKAIGVDFAFPTRTVHLVTAPADAARTAPGPALATGPATGPQGA